MICRKCNKPKSVADFHRDTSQHNSVKTICKDCVYLNRRQNYNAKQAKSYSVKKYWPNSSAEEALSNYIKLLKDQDGKCGICKIGFSETTKEFAVDHCHETNKVRGLLCSKCNTFIGMANENIDALFNAICYLRKHK